MSCPHCWIVEPVDGRPHYVYRCSLCGGCYACQHRASADRRSWRCADGQFRTTGFDDGIPVPPKTARVF